MGMGGEFTERMAAIRALPWIECLAGWMPPGVTPSVDPTEPRVRCLRENPNLGFFFGRDPAHAFWESKWSYLALRSAILRNSTWAGQAPRAVRLADLARDSGLSPKTTQVMIDRAVVTGDLRRDRAEEDRRLVVLTPTPRLVARAEAHLNGMVSTMCGFVGAADPQQGLTPAQRRLVRAVFLDLILSAADPARSGRREALRKAFCFALWDLLLDGEQEVARFVTEEAARLRVTEVTIRNVIARAREAGWLEPAAQLRTTPMARQRFSGMFTVLELRWRKVLALLADASAVAGEGPR